MKKTSCLITAAALVAFAAPANAGWGSRFSIGLDHQAKRELRQAGVEIYSEPFTA